MQVNNYGNSPVYNNSQSQPVTYNPESSQIPSSYGTVDQYSTNTQSTGSGLGSLFSQKRQIVTKQDVLLGASAAGIGFLIGGPVGAAIGGAIGLLIGILSKVFSSMSDSKKAASTVATPVNQQVQQNFALNQTSNKTSQSDAYYQQLKLQESLKKDD